MLGGSRRGGRRVKGMRVSKSTALGEGSGMPLPASRQTEAANVEQIVASQGAQETERSQSDDDLFNSDNRDRQPTVQASSERHWREPVPDQDWGQTEDDRQGLEGHIANSDLLNPADALHLLAQVADLESDGQSGSPGPSGPTGTTNMLAPGRGDASSGTYQYPPISDGHLTLSDASRLIQQFVFLCLFLANTY